MLAVISNILLQPHNAYAVQETVLDAAKLSVFTFIQGHGLDIYLRWMYGFSLTGSSLWYHIPVSSISWLSYSDRRV